MSYLKGWSKKQLKVEISRLVGVAADRRIVDKRLEIELTSIRKAIRQLAEGV